MSPQNGVEPIGLQQKMATMGVEKSYGISKNDIEGSRIFISRLLISMLDGKNNPIASLMILMKGKQRDVYAPEL